MRMSLKKVLVVILVCVLGFTPMGFENYNVKTASAEADYTQLATELPLNGVWTDGWMTDTNTEQWFKINVPADGKITFKIMAYMSFLSYCVYNEDLTNEVCNGKNFYGSETSPATKEHITSLSTGTYYLKIVKEYDNLGKFRLNFAYENYNTNDLGANSYDNPLDLGLSTMITGALTDTNREDWYRITVPSTGYYSVKVTTYLYYMGYVLYNQDMTNKISERWYFDGNSTAPATQNFDLTLDAGVYYIKIYECSNNLGKYFLSMSALTPANCTHSYTSESVSATYVSKGYKMYKCSKCGHSYAGDYTDKLKLGQVYLNSAYNSGKGKLYYYHYGVGDATGYQVRYSTDKKFKKGVKTLKHKKYGGFTIKKLKKKKYYIQVRAYKKVGKKTVYGKWSSKKSVKINK